jgi:phage tail sheath protein FI
MALTSPGVEVTIIDQSQYLPAATGSVPFVLVATAQNKADPTGTGVAVATTAANAGKVYQVTSQRDLVTLYGNPFFYTTTAGTPIQGYELNEYGLLAAYSLLGVTNRCYVLRADIDLASLVGQTGRPTGAPDNGAWWLDTTTSTWGIYQFNATTGQFTLQSPIVITDDAYISAGYPINSIGNMGDYAVIANELTGTPTSDKEFFYKTSNNTWTFVGSLAWKADWPTIQGTASNPVLHAGDTFIINLDGTNSVTITVPDDGGGNGSVTSVANQINLLGWTYLSASVRSGKLCIFGKTSEFPDSNPKYINITNDTGTSLDLMGIPAGTYYQPALAWGTSAEQPLWQVGQTYPRPTGSVWMKVGSAGTGLQPVVAQYSSTIASWKNKNVSLATSDWAASAALDSTGGQTIPAGTVYGQYEFNETIRTSALYLWERYATGPTVVTGTNSTPSFMNTGSIYVYVSIPGSSSLAGPYEVSITSGDNATNFVTAWTAAGIDYTTASVTTDGAIQLIHTEGGEIVMNDVRTSGISGLLLTDNASSISGTSVTAAATYTGVTVTTVTGSGVNAIATVTKTGAGTSYSSSNTTITITTPGSGYNVGDSLKILGTALGGTTTTNDLTFTVGTVVDYQKGASAGIIDEAGFVIGDTNVKYGSPVTSSFTNVPVTGGAGTAGTVNVTIQAGSYDVDPLAANGTGYIVGNTITVSGANLGGTAPANNLTLKVTAIGVGGSLLGVTFVSGTPATNFETQLSNWSAFTYTANQGAPVAAPANNTNWFYSVVNQADIMVNTTDGWVGYKMTNYSTNGFPIPTGVNATDPSGPIISPTEPSTQSDGTALVYGDLWINTTNLEDYPVISRWQLVDGEANWVLIDNTDQVNSTGIVFADARWATNGDTNPADDPIPTIASLLSSDYLDLDAPSSSLYPVGMLLFNTRRSGYNVKQYRVNYFNSMSFPGATLPLQTDAWVSASGLQSNGSPYMGRKAQRAMVVESLRSAIDTNQAIRDEDNFFNLMATPNYPELQPNMVVLNADRGDTGYILGDTPLGLPDSATDIQAWATNAAGATSTGEEGCVTRNTYLGLFYPSGIAFDLSGNEVAVPSSHMMLRTFLRNDNIAYPWLAAAGTRRGVIDNAANIGYVNRTTGEFQVIKTRLGIRDVLYTNFINPMVFFTGNGLLNYGNKTSFDSSSALDRTNVARLIAYIRRQLTLAARPFVFEPNDAFTRGQIANAVTSLMLDLQAKRGIYDYLVVCDESNNTPARIDRNELWVDVAIEPVKAAEFIYIPVRILNTGELAAL